MPATLSQLVAALARLRASSALRSPRLAIARWVELFDTHHVRLLSMGIASLHPSYGLEPRAKPRQLARGKLLDGLLDVFGGGHVRYIALARRAEKGRVQS